MPMRQLLRLGKPKIFCISFQRTGTTSVGQFFRDFGYRTVGWSEAERHHFPEAWLDGDYEFILNHPVVRRGLLFEDSPWFHPDFYKVLYQRFPDAKFILMTRDPEAWFSSMRHHELIPNLVSTPNHCKVYRRESELFELVDSGRYAAGERLKLDDAPEHYKAIYDLHRREAEEFFRRKAPGSLFRAELEDPLKWRKLADFVGLNIPADYEAHENRSSRR